MSRDRNLESLAGYARRALDSHVNVCDECWRIPFEYCDEGNRLMLRAQDLLHRKTRPKRSAWKSFCLCLRRMFWYDVGSLLADSDEWSDRYAQTAERYRRMIWGKRDRWGRNP